MAIGVYLHVAETHAHMHRHEPLGHEHRMRMISTINMSTRRTIRPGSLIATVTGTVGYYTSIRIILTCITATCMSTRERAERPASREGLND